MSEPTKSFWIGALWVFVYLGLVLGPPLVLLIPPVQPGLGFWWDFSMALGFSGTAMMGVQFALTARFRRATAPFGIDVIYYFHRHVAVLAFLLIAAHVLAIRLTSPSALEPANPLQAPWYMTLGRGAFALFAVVLTTSLWRKRLGLEYDRWRMLHATLAAAGLLLLLGHVSGAAYSIQDPIKRIVWTAFSAFWLLLIVHVRLVRPWRLQRRPYQVIEVRKERGRVWTVALAPSGDYGIRFQPGQFAWLTLRSSPFALREHPFSFSSSPTLSEGRLEFSIKELGDFTGTIRDIHIGETAYVDGPYGIFSADRYPASPGFVFIAGGIGIAPIISMLRAFAGRQERRPLILFYGNQVWERVAFREELDRLKTQLRLDLFHVLGEPPAEWSGERGLVTRDVLSRRLPADLQRFEYFVCGPNPMLRSVEQSLASLKVPFRRVHSEIFDLA